jgi:hypothetical protein
VSWRGVEGVTLGQGKKMGGKNMKKEKTESWRDRIIRKIANLRFEISKGKLAWVNTDGDG